MYNNSIESSWYQNSRMDAFVDNLVQVEQSGGGWAVFQRNASDGQATPEDHDDWSAVTEGMGDFAKSDSEGEDPGSPLMRPHSRSLPERVHRITP